jgi:hypothetical protein
MIGELHASAALPLGKEHLVPLDRRMGGQKSRSEHYGEEIVPFANRTPAVQPVARRYAD